MVVIKNGSAVFHQVNRMLKAGAEVVVDSFWVTERFLDQLVFLKYLRLLPCRSPSMAVALATPYFLTSYSWLKLIWRGYDGFLSLSFRGVR